MPYYYIHFCLTITSFGLVGIVDKNNTPLLKYLRSYYYIMKVYFLTSGNSIAWTSSCANLLIVASVFAKK